MTKMGLMAYACYQARLQYHRLAPFNQKAVACTSSPGADLFISERSGSIGEGLALRCFLRILGIARVVSPDVYTYT